MMWNASVLVGWSGFVSWVKRGEVERERFVSGKEGIRRRGTACGCGDFRWMK
jgi:hypothetical protein